MRRRDFLDALLDAGENILGLGALSSQMPSHSRRLPHVYPEGRDLFVTWCLHDALPASCTVPPAKFSAGQAFVWIDRQLDAARSGPRYLRDPSVARVVVDSIYRGVGLGHYELHAYVVMANHVHLLMLPLVDPSHVMRSLKGATAREANRILRRTGTSFWQKESYDHWVRDRVELERIRAYIEHNPVKAGIVAASADYPWSSAGVEMSLDAARTSACATSGQ